MPIREYLNSSQIAAFLDLQLSEDGVSSELPTVSRLLGRKRFIERRIEDIRLELGIEIQGKIGSRRGTIPIADVHRILTRMVEEVEISAKERLEKGRGANLRRVGISNTLIEKTKDRWSK